jgi:hypothetical protein
MTSSGTPSFSDAVLHAEQHQQVQMWHAMQVVNSHVAVEDQRQEVLDCLGLTDVVRPAGL